MTKENEMPTVTIPKNHEVLGPLFGGSTITISTVMAYIQEEKYAGTLREPFFLAWSSLLH